MMRLSQVARTLNVGISTIVDHLSAKGYEVVSNPNTKINFEQIESLAKDFNSGDLRSMLKPSAREEKAPEESVVKEKHKSDIDDILYFRSPQTAASTEKDESKPESPKEQVEETKLPGIKVIGKIDLKTGKPIIAKEDVRVETPQTDAPVPSSPSATETPEVKPAAEETIPSIQPAKNPLVEPTAAETKVAEVKIETPVEKEIENRKNTVSVDAEPVKEEKIPVQEKTTKTPEVVPPVSQEKNVPAIPVTNKPKPEKSQESETTAAVKPAEQIIQKQHPVTSNPVPPVEAPQNEESAVIEAKGETLRGLRVVGKIQLPVDPPKKKDAPATNDSADRKRKRKRKRIRENDVPANQRPNVVKPAGTPATTSPGDQKNKPQTGTPAVNTTTTPGKTGNAPAQQQKSGTGKPQHAGRRRERREEVSDKEVSDNIKATMARMGGSNVRGGARGRGGRKRDRNDGTGMDGGNLEESKILKVTEFISANDLSSLMDVTVQEVISVCLNMGMFVSINQRLDAEAITFIADEFGFEVEFISAEEESDQIEETEIDNPEDLKERAPIVTIMGHVDHGKTSLLDYIRSANVASGEAGGITQHIGAYSVKTKTGKMVTFLDTPGHEAFTAMRARGAKITDVVIIVIAADDSVMPQTREAINHAQVAGVPIVFAFSKVDKPGANSEKIREELANMNLLVEDWGGKYQSQEISSKSGMGVNELLEKVLLEAEMLDLKANPAKKASGTVIEATLDKGRGYTTTILIQAGTLKIGDIVLAGSHFGRVKAMADYRGKRLKDAGPSIPVLLLGLNGAPQAGDKFTVMDTEREAREIATKREQIAREQSIRARKHITLEEIGRRKAIGSFKELNLIIKGDVDGSVEALADSLQQLTTAEVQISIIHKAVGQISESDVNLAIASDAIIVGFQVRPSPNAKKMAEQEQIEIRHYSVIYQAIDEIKDAMTGMLAPTIEEFVTGNIEIRETFKISRIGTIAGCYVTDGFVKRNNKIRIIRAGIVIHTGEIDSLKRYKDDVNEVKSGYECGLNIKNFNDIEEGDIIESFELREVKRTL